MSLVNDGCIVFIRLYLRVAVCNQGLGRSNKCIGFIGGSEEYSLSDWRIQGWRQAMDVAGLLTDGLFAQGDFTYDSGAAAARLLLSAKERPTAIIACSDQMALATLEVAVAQGLNVPNDLSLISFDNSSVVRFTEPQLTAVDQPIAATFSKAVDLLINHPDRCSSAQPVVTNGSLIKRGSTAPPATHARL